MHFIAYYSQLLILWIFSDLLSSSFLTVCNSDSIRKFKAIDWDTWVAQSVT